MGGSTEQFGSHKGYGYAMLCELLSAGLSQGAMSNHTMEGGKGKICHFFLAMDPSLFGDAEAIKSHFSAYLQELRNSPKAEGQTRIYTHGEKEVAAVEKMMQDGIPVNDNTMVEIYEMCQYLHMDFSKYFGDYVPPKSNFKGNQF